MRTNLRAIAMAVIVMLTGCKKNVDESQGIPPDNKKNQKIKTWFENKTGAGKKAPHTVNFPDGKPVWKNAMYDPENKTLLVPVDIVFRGANDHVTMKEYLLVKEDSIGEAESAKYIVILSESKGDSYLPEILPAWDILFSKNISGDFSGSIIEYDLLYKQLVSRHYDDGKPTAYKKDKLAGKMMTVNNNAPLPECDGPETCIDWYWQTYVNGVLVYEEYLYTTCSCYNTGGGGGGGGGNNDECQTMLDAVINSTVPSGELRDVTLLEEGPATRSREYRWICLVNYGGWGLLSTERGVHKKVNNPNPSLQWQWESLAHIGIQKEGISVGGSVDYSDVIATPTLGLYNAVMNLSVRIVFSVVCSYGPAVRDKIYQCNKMFNVNAGSAAN
jgi:hypothetical protein